MSITTETSMEGDILTINQAAAYLTISKATLYTWRTRRVGFGPRAPESDVSAPVWIGHSLFAIRYSLFVARRNSRGSHRPSPIAHRPSPIAHQTGTVLRTLNTASANRAQ